MFIQRKFRSFIVPLLFLSCSLQAQFMGREYMSVLSSSAEEEALAGLRLDAGGFFHNLEFFDVSEEGYTLPGSYLQPLLWYSPTPELSLGAGAHLLYYHGEEEFKQTLPFFQLEYRPVPDLSLKIGSYKGGLALEMPEPLNDITNQFTRLVNQGVEIHYRGPVHRSLTWLDWQEFIEPGDSAQEVFVFGNSSKIRIFTAEKSRLALPLYLLAKHRGGQINESADPVITRFNAGSGLEYALDLEGTVWQELRIHAEYFFQSNGIENKRGYAFYPRAEIGGDLFHLSAGYFYGVEWESVMGFRLFHFDPLKEAEYLNGNPRFITFKAALNHNIGNRACLVVRFDGYYDQVVDKLQYVYGIQLLYSDFISVFKRESD